MKIQKKTIEIQNDEVLNYLKIRGWYNTAKQEVIKRNILRTEAANMGIRIAAEELQEAVDMFRILRNLNKVKDTENWLKDHQIDFEALQDYLEINLLKMKIIEKIEKAKEFESLYQYPQVKEKMRNIIYNEWISNKLQGY